MFNLVIKQRSAEKTDDNQELDIASLRLTAEVIIENMIIFMYSQAVQ